jgi:MYXO-CTERM domain-containing protein
MFFDPARGAVLLHGGSTGDGSGPLADTWVLGPSGWSVLAGSAPTPVLASPMALNRKRSEWLRFGGETAAGVRVAETWVLDASGWAQRTTERSPSPRSRHGLAWDEGRQGVVLFGGLAPDGAVLADTWLFDGNSWTEIGSALTPLGRERPGLVYDPFRRRVVLAGGISAGLNVLNDTWILTQSGWTSVLDTSASAPRSTLSGQLFALGTRPSLVRTGTMVSTGSFFGFPFLSYRSAETWLLMTRGNACSTNQECNTGSCVDGACCEVAACGTCETCNGITPGRCSSVINAEDPDTCSGTSNQTCDRQGTCGPGPGALCVANTDCATGYCVEGVCCDQACNGTCQACRAASKLAAKDDGRCGPAKPGTNPGGLCGEASVCGAGGVCETGAICQSATTVLDLDGSVRSCGDYVCRAGVCATSCASIADCREPLECDAKTRKCLPSVAPTTTCGCAAGEPNTLVGGALLVVTAALARRRKRRGSHS